MFQQLSKCPVCGGSLVTARQYCSQCDTSIEGHFHPAVSPFGQLTPEQLQFVLAFVRCEGRFTRLEEELGMSYPTLRNRLYDIIRALGFEPGREEAAAPVRLNADDRRRILEDLEQGKITTSEAQALLRGKREEESGA
jgi:hypothetical protein